MLTRHLGLHDSQSWLACLAGLHIIQTQTQSRVCITVKNSPNFPECWDEAMETRKKVLYCFYKMFLKDNSSNEGKCWFFYF